MSKGAQTHDRSLWLLAAPIAMLNALLFLWVTLKPAPAAVIVAVDDWGEPLGLLAIITLYFALARRLHPRLTRAQRRATTLLACGALCYALGELIWAFYEEILRQSPFPSLADVAYLAAYPCLLAAILCLPARALSGLARLRILLDGLLIMCAVATFSWYFILGPTIVTGDGSWLAKIVGATYPLADVVLVCCNVLIVYRVRDARLRQPLIWLALGLLAIVAADSIFDIQSLQNAYASGNALDVCWTVGYSLLVLAAYQMRHNWSRRAQATGAPQFDMEDHRWHVIRAVLPYAFIPAVFGLAYYTWRMPGDEQYEIGTYIGCVMLLALVFVRQLVAQRETLQHYQRSNQLNKTLRRMQRELQAEHDALTQANARLEALATIDPLTGLPNHRAMVAQLDHALDTARSVATACAVLFFDLDHFKTMNDTYGHATGDIVLREFAAIVQSEMRSGDTLGRWGGEEFLAIAPAVTASEALALAERIRAAVAAQPLNIGGGLGMTCSIGLSLFPHDATGRDALVHAADQAMYAAKRLGRNQARLISDPEVVALEHDAQHGATREAATLEGIVAALAALIAARDGYTGQHVESVAGLATTIALELGLSHNEARLIGLVGRLHDLGKIAIPDAILRKPGSLTDDEIAIMRRHPVVGAEIISQIPPLRGLAPLIRAHHERWDGAGYPDGLAGEAIPLGARIVTIVDAYDVMVSGRLYQSPRDAAFAAQELRRCAGQQFDPRIVEVLLRHIAETSTATPAA